MPEEVLTGTLIHVGNITKVRERFTPMNTHMFDAKTIDLGGWIISCALEGRDPVFNRLGLRHQWNFYISDTLFEKKFDIIDQLNGGAVSIKRKESLDATENYLDNRLHDDERAY